MLIEGKKVLLLKVVIVLCGLQYEEACAQFKLGTTIFNIPSVPKSISEKISQEGNKIIEFIDFKEAGSGNDKTYSLNIPIRQPDGSYTPAAISYSESENTRTVTIPGQGSVNIIKDETGEFNLVLTPKQIKESSNVSCSVGLSGKGKCTIEPFVTMIGGKFLTADKLTVDYQNGQNLNISGGTASNLRLTEKDSTTTFNRSETKAGDLGFKVKFGVDYKKDMEIFVDTAQLVHTVTNPKDPSQTGTKFRVLGGGVSSSLIIDRRENTKIKFNGLTQGGIQYDSNPFSDKKVLVETSSPVKATFDLNRNRESSNSALSLSLNALDKDGKKSTLTIVDTRVDGKKNTVTSIGETYVNLNHIKSLTDSRVGVELGSEHLVLKNETGKGNVTETEVFGLHGNADANGAGEKKISVQADSLNLKNSKLNSQVQTSSIQGAFQENDTEKKFELLTGHAYYSNGETLASVQGAQVNVIDFKNPQKADTFNGKAIKKDSVIIGSEVHIRNAGSSTDLNNGVVIRQIDLADAGSVTLVNGKNGSLLSEDYNLQLKENFNLISEQDNKGQPTFTRIKADDFSHQNKKGSLQILNSDTSLKLIGGATDGKSGLEIKHSSEGIGYIKNNGALSANVAKLKLEVEDTKTIKYGDVQFDQLTYKNENFKKQEELKIIGAKAVFFTDNTDPTNKIKKGELELDKLGVKAGEQVFEIVAKDAKGVEGKFKIHLYQDGQTKNYQIFTDEGKRVYFDGVDKNNRHASVVLEAVKYLESKEFKQVYANNLAGKLQTVEGSSEKLQAFSVGSVNGVVKADGSQKQFVLKDGSFSEISQNRNINLSVDNVKYNQEGINGNKASSITIEGGETSYKKDQAEAELKGAGIKAFSADKIKYGEVKFDQLKFNNGKSDTKDAIRILGAKAVFFTDNTDPINKIKKGELELEKLGVKAGGQVFEIVAKDAQGLEGKFKIHLYQDGQTKNYQIFTEEGKRVYFDGVDKNNRHASVVLEAVKYLDTKEFKQVFAKNLAGKLQTVDGSSEKLQAFSFGSVEGLINANGTKKQFVFTDGAITDVKAGTGKNLKFNKLEYDLETADGKNVSSKTIQDGVYSEESDGGKSNLSFVGLQDVKVASDGKMVSAKYIKNGTLNETNGNKTSTLTFNNLDNVTETVDEIKNLNVNLEGGKASYKKDQIEAEGKGIDLKFNISDKIKYGAVQFNQLTYKNEDFKKQEEIKIIGAKAVIFTDNTDPTNKIKKGELELEKLGAKASGQIFDIVAKDAQGVEGKFKIHLYQDGQTKNYQILTEEGKKVYFDGVDKNNRHASVVLEAVKYLETKEFKQIFAKNLAMKLQTVDGQSEKLRVFSIGNLSASVKADGTQKQFSLRDGTFSETSGDNQMNLSVKNVDYNQEGKNGNKESFIDLKGGEASYKKDQTEAELKGIDVSAFSADKIKYGEVKFNQLKFNNGTPNTKEEIKIIGAKAVIFTDNTDPTNKIKTGELELEKLGAKASGQIFDIVAKDAQGVEGKFKIHLYQDGQTKNYQILTEEGKKVYFDGVDKNNRHASVVLEAVKYLETKEFKQVFAKNLAGKLQTVKGGNEKLQAFSLGSLMLSKGNSSSEALLSNVSVSQSEFGKASSNLNIQSLQVNQNHYLDSKDLKGEILNGVVKHVQYDGKKTSQTADLSIGSLLVNQKTKGAEKVTMLSVKDMDVMVVDYNELIKLSGKIGAVDFFQNSQMQTIEVSNLKDIAIKDLSSGFSGTLNSDKIIRIVNKDSTGKEIGSYLLVNSTFLNAQDIKNGVNANLRVGVLELLQDKLTGQNVFLNADVNGKIILDKTKSPIAGEANFALKGQNLVTENKSYVSDDGNTVGKYFAINGIDPKGRLDSVKLSAGPSFLKEAISIEAKGSEKGGKSLNFTFQQDKGNGTYYVKAEFKNGDKVKVKLFPFTLESKVQGTDALAEVMLAPKGQNFYNHLEIISNVVSENEITDWLGVSNGGMLVARTGTLGGFGFEMMYQNQNYYNPENDLKGQTGTAKAASIGAGIFHKNDKGDRLSAGVLLSGDSEFNLQTNGNGVLKIFGVGMDKDARIPATINLYLKKDWADGDSLYGGVFIDTASLAVDSDRLNKNAAFHNGGRVAGKMGASVAYTKQLSNYSKITVAAGVNENFSSPAICVAYSVALDRKDSLTLKDLTSDTMKITSEVMRRYEEDPSSVQRSSTEGKIIALKIELSDLEASRSDALALERIKKALNETLESINNKAPANLSFQNLISIKEEDLNVLRKLEQKKVTHKYSQEIEKLIKAVNEDMRVKRNIGRVSEKASGFNQTLTKLTREFEENNSAEIHRQYLQKLEELSNLMGVTLSE